MRLHLDILKLLHFAFCCMPLSSKIDCICQVFERIRPMGSNFTWLCCQTQYSASNSRNVSQSLWLKSLGTIEELLGQSKGMWNGWKYYVYYPNYVINVMEMQILMHR